MENSRFVTSTFITIMGGALLVLPLFGYAYDDKTTHPALTQEIVKFFNHSFPDNALNDQEKELLIQGSIDEDSGTRPMQHFYDPVYKRGLVLGKEWMSSKHWAQNTKAQAGITASALAGTFKPLFSSNEDYSWDRAIYEYTWGDKTRGLKALGHILHLLEDATVPDHTRNDPHPPYLELGSPYEFWTEQFDRQNIKIFSELSNQKPIVLANINNYFDTLATYSNNNFFSRDTILDKEYDRPIINNYIDGFGLSVDSYPLVQKIKKFDGTIEYSLVDNKRVILNSYWTLLSKQAVLHGAGAMKLFFDEVEKEKQSKILYGKNRSWLDKQKDKFASAVFNIAKALYGSSVTEKDLADLNDEGASVALTITPRTEPQKPQENTARDSSPLAQNDSTVGAQNDRGGAQDDRSSARDDNKLAQVNTTPPPAPQKISTPITSPLSSSPSVFGPVIAAPFAAGAGAAPPPPPPPAETTTASPIPSPPPADTTPPAAPVISSPTENFVASTTSIIFSGTAEAASTITNDFATSTATTTDANGNWLLSIDSLPQSTTTIQFFAKDSAGNISSGTSRTVFIDSTAPDLAFSVNECSQSFSPDACLVATTTVTLAWFSNAADIDSYFLNSIGTTSTSTAMTLADNTASTFTMEARDTRGNTSATQSKTVEVAVRPVVINEVAWMGTSAAQSQDEWIELYNTTSRAITLSGWVLRSKTDNSPFISLSGTIPAKGFFLLERTDDTTISNISAHQIYTGALVNTGEILELSRASTTIDATQNPNLCGGWCAGNDTAYSTMERYDPFGDGAAVTSWLTASTFLRNGTNADGAAITGTPAARNTAHYLIDRSTFISSSKTITKTRSPYVIPSTTDIAKGATLTINPGVVIKFSGANSSLAVNGALDARGTAADPIVFTSLKDDAYGGDLNNDGSATIPQPGDWNTLNIKSGAQALLDNMLIRYGGNTADFSGYLAAIKIENASTTLTNSVIEKSGGYGIWMKNASGTIENNTIRDNAANVSEASTGLVLSQSSPVVRKNTFSGNTYGLSVSGTTSLPLISQNTFTNNTQYPISVVVAYPTFSENTASANGKNGILMQNTLVRDYTLSPDLPYILTNQNFSVPKALVLTLQPGVIIKMQGFTPLTVAGKLVAQGTSEKKIVFTSINDDDCGIPPPAGGGCGDTNGAATIAQAGDWQSIDFNLGSSSSTLEHVIIRYGGTGDTVGAVRILNTSIDIKNSLIEKNYYAGIFMQNSTSTTISNSTIQNHTDGTATTMYGIYLTAASTPAITNTVFQNNEKNIYIGAASSFTDAGGNTPSPLQ